MAGELQSFDSPRDDNCCATDRCSLTDEHATPLPWCISMSLAVIQATLSVAFLAVLALVGEIVIRPR